MIHTAPLTGEVLPPPVRTIPVPVALVAALLRAEPDMRGRHLVNLARIGRRNA